MWTPKIKSYGCLKDATTSVIVTAIVNFKGVISGNYVFQNGVHDISESTWPIDSKF